MKLKKTLRTPLILVICSIAAAAFLYQGTKRPSCDAVSSEISAENFKIRVHAYQTLPASTKALLIVPPTGGENILDRLYAESFCKAGFNVYILAGWSDDDELNYDLEIHQRFYKRAQKAISMVVDSLSETSIGIFGTSVGAIHSSIAVGNNEKIQAAFVVVGGAPIPSVIVHSDQTAMRVAKEKRKDLYGFKSDAEYEAALTAKLNYDPLKITSIKGKKLGMVIAEKDSTVPTETQLKLKEFWQPQQIYFLNWGHMNAIILTWLLHSEDIVDFFRSIPN